MSERASSSSRVARPLFLSTGGPRVRAPLRGLTHACVRGASLPPSLRPSLRPSDSRAQRVGWTGGRGRSVHLCTEPEDRGDPSPFSVPSLNRSLAAAAAAARRSSVNWFSNSGLFAAAVAAACTWQGAKMEGLNNGATRHLLPHPKRKVKAF